VSLFDETALRELVAEATEAALRKVLRGNSERPEAARRWASTAQLATEYSIAQKTIRQWVRQGRVRGIRVGGVLRASVEDFERMVSPARTTASGRTQSPEELADIDEDRERKKRRG
jgi:hypothetical protein